MRICVHLRPGLSDDQAVPIPNTKVARRSVTRQAGEAWRPDTPRPVFPSDTKVVSVRTFPG